MQQMESQIEVNVVYMVATDSVKVAPFNPGPRTDPGALRDLMAQIKTAGRIINPLIISYEEGVLADGHRRLACAKALAMDTVPVRYEHGTAQELFQQLNEGARPLSSKEWAESVASGLSLDFVARRHRTTISALYELLGPEDYVEMFGIRRHVSPGVYGWAKKMASYMGDDTPDMVRQCVIWLEKHGMQKYTRDAMDQGIDPYQLFLAVTDDRPIVNRWAAA